MESIRLTKDIRKNFIQFMYYYANGTLPFVVGHSILNDGEYVERLLEIPSNFETMTAIYMNNILIDEVGMVVNQKHAMTRAAQFIRSAFDGDYIVEPPFEDWEFEKHQK